uniref:Putative flavin-binding monooxygenase n=1 Tax=mine drainage metagenome TaxID=410659 RepID=E6Q2T5_9ZZZZ
MGIAMTYYHDVHGKNFEGVPESLISFRPYVAD